MHQRSHVKAAHQDPKFFVFYTTQNAKTNRGSLVHQAQCNVLIKNKIFLYLFLESIETFYLIWLTIKSLGGLAFSRASFCALIDTLHRKKVPYSVVCLNFLSPAFYTCIPCIKPQVLSSWYFGWHRIQSNKRWLCHLYYWSSFWLKTTECICLGLEFFKPSTALCNDGGLMQNWCERQRES